MRKEQKVVTEEKYLWLDKSYERKYMSDEEILRKYINLDNTCLNRKEKEEAMDMSYKYKDAFSLRDEIGTCLNIEVGIEVMDKSPFFIRLYHIREEDKKLIDEEMKRLCYLGILKEGFSPYSSPVMLISCKKKKFLQYFTIFWKHLIYVSENAYGIKYIPLHLAVIYKCNFRLFGN